MSKKGRRGGGFSKSIAVSPDQLKDACSSCWEHETLYKQGS